MSDAERKNLQTELQTDWFGRPLVRPEFEPWANKSFELSMTRYEKMGYLYLIREIWPYIQPHYEAMSATQYPDACFQSVDRAIADLSQIYLKRTYSHVVLGFNKPVIDAVGIQESGQFMLGIRVENPHTDSKLVVDVAGYLFGFPYPEMFMCAGSDEYIGKKASEHYSKKYPGLIAQVLPTEND